MLSQLVFTGEPAKHHGSSSRHVVYIYIFQKEMYEQIMKIQYMAERPAGLMLRDWWNELRCSARGWGVIELQFG